MALTNEQLLLLLGAVVGLLVVGAFGTGLVLGLWWGERGRRRDAHRREQGLPPEPPPAAKVVAPGDEQPHHQPELGEPPDKFLEDLMASTGCSEKEAREEWNRLLNASHGDRSTSWSPTV